ncbi:hypothetical protein [Nitratireductor soli]|uniref:hypothetical protein n=1 Tax=Nitratireductor soli TaxID=1670619 RepID=UPI000AF25C38|nr:hypothetical protein [Nitratireductor soli]
MYVEMVNVAGETAAKHGLAFAFSMMLPGFRGVPAVYGIHGHGHGGEHRRPAHAGY